MNKKITFTKDIEHLFNIFEEKGKELYLVGGSVRDMLLSREPKDFDFATNALPNEVITYFEKVMPTGIDYGTVTVMIGDEGYEITTYRKDHDSDGRRPKAVSFSETIEDDLCRRDFTINSMAMDRSGHIIDPFNGQRDLKLKLIKFVGNSIDRVSEDKLRLIRGIRFATTYDFNIDTNDYESVYLKATDFDFSRVANERFQAELNKMLLSNNPKLGLELLEKTGIMDLFIPEMRAMVGFEQKNPHHYTDVFGHTLDVVSNTPSDLILRLSGMFHDIGKPMVFSLDKKGTGHFYTHELESAKMTKSILERLHYDTATIKLVELFISNHMRKDIPKNKSSIRRMIRDIGKENILRFIKLMEADESSTNNRPEDKYDNFSNVVTELLNENPVVSRFGLNINGNDLMDTFNISGKTIGSVLTHLTEIIIEEPELNEKVGLLDKAKEYLERV